MGPHRERAEEQQPHRSIEKGKYADMIVTAGNPLDDLRVLRNLEMVITKGNIIDHPKIKKRKNVDAELDKFL